MGTGVFEQYRNARVGRLTVTGGALLQVVGLAVDYAMHSADPTLAARESVFTLTNVGHSLFGAGLLMVVIGAMVLADAARRGQAEPRPGPWRRAAYGIGAVGVLAAAGYLGTQGDVEHAGLEQAEGAKVHITFIRDTLGAHEGHAAGGEGVDSTGIERQPEVDQRLFESSRHHSGLAPHELIADPAARRQLGAELDVLKAFLLQHPTPREALASGYRQVAPYYPGMGVHYLKQQLIDDVFEFDAPELLIYDAQGPDANVVGAKYLFVDDEPPEGFTGPNDRWHVHPGGVCTDETGFVIGPEELDGPGCEAIGGIDYFEGNEWVLHVWNIPGFENPWGVFADLNPNQDGRTDWDEVRRPGGIRDQAVAAAEAAGILPFEVEDPTASG